MCNCYLFLRKPLICSELFHKLLKYPLYAFLLFMRYSTVWATSKISTQKYLLRQGLYNECVAIVIIAVIICRARVISPRTRFLLILQGICTLEGEEHCNREKGPHPQPGAANARIPAQRTLAGSPTHNSAVHWHHH